MEITKILILLMSAVYISMMIFLSIVVGSQKSSFLFQYQAMQGMVKSSILQVVLVSLNAPAVALAVAVVAVCNILQSGRMRGGIRQPEALQ